MLVDKALKKGILKDIDIVQAASSEVVFEKLNEIMLLKYSEETEFIKYYKDQHLLKNMNWYEGAAPYSPSSNNALEATNGVIKSTYTNRDRLPVSRFFTLALSMTADWSKDRAPGPNQKIFNTRVSPSLKEWTNAYNIAKGQSEFLHAVILLLELNNH